MSMNLGLIIQVLIQLCILVLIVYVVIWVLGSLGIALPAQIIQILWVIVALVALYWIVVTILPGVIRMGNSGAAYGYDITDLPPLQRAL